MQVDDQERDGVMEHLCTCTCSTSIAFAAGILVLLPIMIYSFSYELASYNMGLEFDCLSGTNKEMSAVRGGVGGEEERVTNKEMSTIRGGVGGR